MKKIIELPCSVGDKVYWVWCDYKGEPDSEIQEEYILYFYINEYEGVGISTDNYDGHLGNYIKDGELVDHVLRIFLSKEAAENYLNKTNK